MTTAIEHLGVDPGNAATEEFKREPRYIVFKLKDAHAYLKAAEIRQLEKIGSTIAVNRAFHGKPPFNAVVVEQDWPEFDLVWSMIEARMTGTGNDHRRTVACTAACAGIPTEKLAGIGSAIGERASELIARADQRDELLSLVKGFHRKLETYRNVYSGDKELRRLLDECEASIAKANP